MDQRATQYRSCPTHCCPKHGCKYGYEDCPVKNETVAPVYPHNNGCEICEDDLDETLRLIASSNELIDAISLVCSDAYQAGQGFRSWPWSSDDERGYIRRRLLESLDS